MAAAIEAELRGLHCTVDENDSERSREIVENIQNICVRDVTHRDEGLYPSPHSTRLA